MQKNVSTAVLLLTTIFTQLIFTTTINDNNKPPYLSARKQEQFIDDNKAFHCLEYLERNDVKLFTEQSERERSVCDECRTFIKEWIRLNEIGYYNR